MKNKNDVWECYEFLLLEIMATSLCPFSYDKQGSILVGHAFIGLLSRGVSMLPVSAQELSERISGTER